MNNIILDSHTQKIDALFKDEKLQKYLLNYAFLLTKSLENAEDLVQHAYMKVRENKESVVLETPVGLLRTIIKNKFIDSTRKTKGVYFVRGEEFLDNSSIDNHGEMNLTVQEIKNSINSNLKNKKQLEVTKLLMEGYKYRDISENMNISESDVKITIYRARNSIKKILHKKNKSI